MKTSIKYYFTVFSKAVAMGAADVIPGVSGGTVAFISGIYEKIIESLNNVDVEALKLLFTGKWKQLEKKINGFFLIALCSGIMVSVFSFAKLVLYLLRTYEVAVWSFFFGLIVASAVVIAKSIKWEIKDSFGLLVGAIIAFYLTTISPIQTPNTIIYLFFSGAISIIAMILPGISGSFILVILGKYTYIISLVSGVGEGIKTIIASIAHVDFNTITASYNHMQILPLFIFWMGTLTGILGFSRVLNWLFKKWRNLTISILSGFMIGALNTVWPWKHTISTYTDSHGNIVPIVRESVLPSTYHQLTGNEHLLITAIIMSLFGFALVYFMELYAEKMKAKVTA